MTLAASTLAVGTALFFGLYLAVALFVLTLPRAEAQRDPARPRILGDLRFWAIVSAGIQIAIYLLL